MVISVAVVFFETIGGIPFVDAEAKKLLVLAPEYLARPNLFGPLGGALNSSAG
tara:strand:- start:30 stop:188 length:159 start_codon:yes stop_codon:yes gene_type:complete